MAQDTDTGPVTIDLSRQELRSVDELPYTAAIAAGVKLVMLSWARFPAFGTNAPAGLAPTIVQGELRDRLHFTGVTITDALGAGALGAYGGYAQRAVSAARAGDDLLLCSTASAAGNSPTKGIAALNGLLAGLEDRSVNRSAAEAAVARIVSLRMAP
jgi:beta-N-acetylhexosaminidase